MKTVFIDVNGVIYMHKFATFGGCFNQVLKEIKGKVTMETLWQLSDTIKEGICYRNMQVRECLISSSIKENRSEFHISKKGVDFLKFSIVG